jgi:hypothetical protein
LKEDRTFLFFGGGGTYKTIRLTGPTGNPVPAGQGPIPVLEKARDTLVGTWHASVTKKTEKGEATIDYTLQLTADGECINTTQVNKGRPKIVRGTWGLMRAEGNRVVISRYFDFHNSDTVTFDLVSDQQIEGQLPNGARYTYKRQ